MQFKDATGRVWTPRTTCQAVMRFEKRCDVGIFEAIFKAFRISDDDPVADGGKRKRRRRGKGRGRGGDAEKADAMKVNARVAIDLCGSIFGRVENVITFMYEICVPDSERGQVSFDDFAKRIEKQQIEAVYRITLVELLEFFPDADDRDELKGEKDNDIPLDRSSGGTSTD